MVKMRCNQRNFLAAALVVCTCATLLFSEASATDISSLLGGGQALKQFSNLANYFVSADKFDGKYAAAGILLAAPVLSGRYSGGDRLSLGQSGTLRNVIEGKLDALFQPLLSAEPFQYDPLGVRKTAGSLFPQQIGTALTAGGDVVSSKLKWKLDSLSAGLGLVRKHSPLDIVDSAVRTKERLVRGAVDEGVKLIENDAQTAALKNLFFRSLIYHVYIDAGINSRLTVLKHMKDRVAGYKEFFGPYAFDVDEVANPVIASLEGVYHSLSEFITLPTKLFYTQKKSDGDDDLMSTFYSFHALLDDLQNQIGSASTSLAKSQTDITRVVQNWLKTIQKTPGIAQADSGLAWADKLRSYIEGETLNWEGQLNDLLSKQNKFLLDFVHGHHLSDIDTSTITDFLSDLGTTTGDTASSALKKYTGFADSVLTSIVGLLKKDVKDTGAYVDAYNLLANSGVHAATTVWKAYERAFDLHHRIAQLVGAEVTKLPEEFPKRFSNLLDVLADTASYFKNKR